ncbi:CHAT domain-containing protein [Cyathus striatus]|nr:CHAT domain-containing protein [Cyathus striatus]
MFEFHIVRRAKILSQFGSFLKEKYYKFSFEDDMKEAKKQYTEALSILSPDHECKVDIIIDFASLFRSKFSMFGHEDDINQAIELIENECHTTHVRAHRLKLLETLASTLVHKCVKLGHTKDLNAAIIHCNEALLLSTNRTKAFPLCELAHIYSIQFKKSGHAEDANMAVKYYNEALQFESHSVRRANLLKELSSFLKEKYYKLGFKEDMKAVKELYKEALSILHPDHKWKINIINDFIDLYRSDFEMFGHEEDINNAITLLEKERHSVNLSNIEKINLLMSLASCLYDKYKQLNHVEDLSAAIDLHKEVIQLVPQDGTFQTSCLSVYARRLEERYFELGNEKDLHTAIEIQREIISLPVNSLLEQHDLCAYAFTLQRRYLCWSHEEDLQAAIEILEKTLLKTPPGSQTNNLRTDILGKLAAFLSQRSRLLESEEDLNSAIKYHEEALLLQPVHMMKQVDSLQGLATTMFTRYSQFRTHENDLKDAINFTTEALSLLPPYHRGRKRTLNTLALCYWYQYEQLGNETDISLAIQYQKEAIEIVNGFSQNENGATIFNLAQFKIRWFLRTGNRECINEIISLFEQLPLTNMNIITTFGCMQVWAAFSDKYQHPSALTAYKLAINLLPLLTAPIFTLASRQRFLAIAGDGFIADAALCSLRQKSFKDAVEVLEAGRSVIWSQASKHPDTGNLVLVAPDLDAQLKVYSLEIEKASKSLIESDDIPMKNFIQSSQNVPHLRHLHNNWLKTLEKIRQIPEYEDFLKPLTFSKLKSTITKGAIVLLNITTSSCDAIIMSPEINDVIHLPIPDVDHALVFSKVKLLKYALNPTERSGPAEISKAQGSLMTLELTRHGKMRARQSLTSVIHEILKWMWSTIVYPIIQTLNLKKSKRPPRLWWCPTGPLTFLPLHAAGIYKSTSSTPSECTSDYCISSYTSTITALTQERGVESKSASQFKFLGIADTKKLLQTANELGVIQQYIPEQYFTELGTSGNPPASMKEVSSHLPDASIVHFACHGKQVPGKPFQSGLLLDDEKYMRISDIMQLSIPNASFAFLSACETASGDEDLPDESLHIGASLIQAGFRSVVGTMWKIRDNDGPIIAKSFYRHLLNDVDFNSNPVKGFDYTKSAEALHYAIKEMQLEGVPVHNWMPFVHIGK